MVISKELIFLKLDEKTKAGMLDILINEAFRQGKLTDREVYLKAVETREEEFSTALGYLVAIPHGQSEAVVEPFVVVATAANSFRWDERTDNAVQLVFMIGVPMHNRDKTHLVILANISRKLMDEDFREKLITAADVDEAYRTLTEIGI